jgi:RNA polymerase sigma-70 factor (ECF subfamily)
MNSPDQADVISRETLLAWKKGDKEAFEKIVRATMKRAYSVALGLVGNADDAHDLSQEAFIAAHRARKSFDIDRPFFPWFYRVLRNRCLNYLKKRARRREISLDVLEERVGRGSADEELLRRERIEMVWRALLTLSPEHREILVLRNFQELSYSEISGVLGVPEGTVMSRLYYARQALLEALRKEGVGSADEGSDTQ